MNKFLNVDFAGLALSSPIIAASAPPTESVQAIRSCADAGVGAVVTKSILDYDRSDWPDIPRRVRKDRSKLWIQGSFASETLTLDEGVSLIADARDHVDIPIIASVGVLNPKDDQCLETALALIAVGADLVHFDLFYLAQPRCSDEMTADLLNLFTRARNTLPTRFGPKLNIDLPATHFAGAVPVEAIDCVFLLDSIRVPPPLGSDGRPKIDAWHGGLEGSLFGDWQRPISFQYARVLADAGMPDLCVGGGLRNDADILDSIMLGASSVQVATQIMVHGYDWIRRTNDALEKRITDHGVRNIGHFKSKALTARDFDKPESVQLVRAVVDPTKCKPCGVCTKLAFCPFIKAQPSGIPIISDACYGCGFCEAYCPQQGAISMEAG